MDIIDIHAHVVSADVQRYPLDPVGGKLAPWAAHEIGVDHLIAAMDEAGIGRAAIVHTSTAYGYDNRYAADSAAAHPDRFCFVGAVDVTAADAPERLTYWVRERGMAGMRIFATRSTMGEGSDDWLADPKTFPAWEAAEKLGIPVCIQTRFGSIEALRVLLERFPRVRVVFDHLAHPPVDDGPPYAAAAPFFDLARHPNLYLKLTELNFRDLARGKAAPRTFIERAVDAFGADRIAWGSNFPASEGSLLELRDHAIQELAFLPQRDQRAILCNTALALYPSLRRDDPE